MTVLEDIKNGAQLRGVVPGQPVEVVSVEWIGDQAINLVYRVPGGGVAETTLYRDDQVRIELDAHGRAWSFDADGDLLRLVTEANRIKLAHYFDPYLAIHTSLVDPLPHQISAVYGEMLPRQPLRFLLADDPGAGKTIMAGLLIKELIARSDLERCLVVAPGSRTISRVSLSRRSSASVVRSSRGKRGGGRSPMSRSASASVTGRSARALQCRRSTNASASRRAR